MPPVGPRRRERRRRQGGETTCGEFRPAFSQFQSLQIRRWSNFMLFRNAFESPKLWKGRSGGAAALFFYLVPLKFNFGKERERKKNGKRGNVNVTVYPRTPRLPRGGPVMGILLYLLKLALLAFLARICPPSVRIRQLEPARQPPHPCVTHPLFSIYLSIYELVSLGHRACSASQAAS